jgi:hypothetical protein
MDDSLEVTAPTASAEAAESLREDVLKLRLRAADSAVGATPSEKVETVPLRTLRTVFAGLLSFAAPAVLMASVFGVSLLVGTNFLGAPRTGASPKSVEGTDVDQAARKMAEEIAMHKTDDPSAHAARSPSDDLLPGSAVPHAEAAQTPISAANDTAPAKNVPTPPKSSQKSSGSRERSDRIGRKIASLGVAAPIVDRSASATAASAKRLQAHRGDAFDPSKNTNAPGAPRQLGTTAASRPLND